MSRGKVSSHEQRKMGKKWWPAEKPKNLHREGHGTKQELGPSGTEGLKATWSKTAEPVRLTASLNGKVGPVTYDGGSEALPTVPRRLLLRGLLFILQGPDWEASSVHLHFKQCESLPPEKPSRPLLISVNPTIASSFDMDVGVFGGQESFNLHNTPFIVRNYYPHSTKGEAASGRNRQ